MVGSSVATLVVELVDPWDLRKAGQLAAAMDHSLAAQLVDKMVIPLADKWVAELALKKDMREVDLREL